MVKDFLHVDDGIEEFLFILDLSSKAKTKLHKRENYFPLEDRTIITVPFHAGSNWRKHGIFDREER